MGSAFDKGLEGKLYIGGEWREAESGARFVVEDPGRGTPLADVANASIADGISAVAAADAAAKSWAKTAPRQRAEILRKAFECMIAEADDLARLITLESGKSYKDSYSEVVYAAEFLRWFSEEAVRGTGAVVTAPSGANQIINTLQPVGLSVFITPWNFPAAMATRKIGAALAAGCTTVLKPAQETPLTSVAIADIFERAGTPAGVVNVVTTNTSSKVIGAMLEDERVRKLSFTGSTQVGKILMAQAAQRVLRTSMELGGNAPFVVLEDADLDLAVNNALIAKLRNGGQACTAANRFYVHRSLEREFVARFADGMRALKVGYGLDAGIDIGSMINAKARAGALELIQSAVDQGAKVITGGNPVGTVGYFLEPTLLADVPLDARPMTEEIFGPVAPVAAFDTVEEVIAYANNTEYGLVAYVQSRDYRQAMMVAEAIDAGMVGINRGVVSDPAAPFGGMKQSGIGREGGHEGLLEYLETKYTAVTW